MIARKEKNRCSGCSACYAVCPKNCISMKADKEGFLYPEVDETKCIHCNKCKAVCPFENLTSDEIVIPTAWGANANDEKLRLVSSSGGVFSLLAKYTLNVGGTVCGSAMSDDCKYAHHVFADDESQLAKLRGSKYLQSFVEDTYKQTKEKLEKGTAVLYLGTPCQIAGLKAFLSKEYTNLLCVGIFCHGAPSPALWSEYVEYCNEKLGAPIANVQFRNKDKGWNKFGLRMETETGVVQNKIAQKDPYMRMFLRNFSLRPSCYQCTAKNNACNADLMIGDFWGVQSIVEELYDNAGTSVIFAYSEKGKRVIDEIKNEMKIYEIQYEDAVMHNSAYTRSVPMPEIREKFFEDFGDVDFASLEKKYVPISTKEHIKMFLEKIHLLEITCKILGK